MFEDHRRPTITGRRLAKDSKIWERDGRFPKIYELMPKAKFFWPKFEVLGILLTQYLEFPNKREGKKNPANSMQLRLVFKPLLRLRFSLLKIIGNRSMTIVYQEYRGSSEVF